MILFIAVYFLVPLPLRWIVLLLGSLVFYAHAGKRMLIAVVLTAAVGYFGAIFIEGTAKEQKRKRRWILTIVSACILGFLIITKAVTVLELSLPGLIIPIGISYYTFSIIGYLADVYWRKDGAEKNFLRFLLFVVYFPKIMQGPISRHRTLAPQLQEGHPFDFQRVAFGLQLMVWGYFKKLIIADRITILTGTVFENWREYSGSILLLGLVLATVQLYCDFSGYMDIAAGISRIFGIELEANFRHPFFSKSVGEFWRRWHITLGTWFKDYVYMPLVISPNIMKFSRFIRKLFGKRAGKAVMSVVPLSVVWILTGLWHGTGLPYVAWGIYWGILIIFSTVFAPEIRKLTDLLHVNIKSESWEIFQMVRTFFLFVFGRLLTVPGDLSVSKQILKRILFSFQGWRLFDGTVYQLGLNVANIHVLLMSVGILWGVSLLQQKGSIREKLCGWNLVFRWAFYVLSVITVLVIGVYGAGYDASAFVYMNY